MNALVPLPTAEAAPTGVSLITKPHVFGPARPVEIVPYGLTLLQMVGSAYPDIAEPREMLRVWFNDEPVDPAVWHLIKPKPGAEIYVHPTAQKAGGGKNVLALVLQVAVLAAGALLPPLLFTSPLLVAGVGAAISIAGNLLIGLLIPPAAPILPQSGATSQTYSLAGGNNSLNQFGPCPSLFGRHRIVPPFGGAPVTELQGKDQFLRSLFLESYGEIEVESRRIGDTPLDSYRDVELETRAGAADDDPRTLYTQDIDERSLNIKLTGGSEGGFFQQQTGLGADEIGFDITWPAGLYGLTRNGEDFRRDVTIYAQYRPVEGVTWYDIPGFPYTLDANLTRVIRGGTRFIPTHLSATKQYAVQLAKPRVDVNPEDGQGSNIVYWTALRTIHHRDPVNLPLVATESIRIRANDQLNGTLDEYNLVAQLLTDDYDAETETWIKRATRNPASAYLRILQGPGRRQPLPDDRIDWDSLEDWHVYCTEQGWTFDAYVDYSSTIAETLRLIAIAGRAAPAMVNGKFGVVIDRLQTEAVQMFTPRNSWGFRGSKEFFELPHGLRMRFRNEDLDWQQDERAVYADGYDEDTATKLDPDEVFGCTNADLIHRHGRFRLAQLTLRAERFELWADAEVLRCTRGDMVRISHDVIMVGLGSGRVIATTDDGGSPAEVVSITLDQELVFAAGKAYGIYFRTVDHGIVSLAVTNPAVTDPVATSTLTLNAVLLRSWLSDPSGAEGGDLVTFGEAGLETEECIITRITPGEDLSAKLTLMSAAPGVYEADTGPIPAFESKITRPTRAAWTSPSPPVVFSVRSDEAVLLRNTDGTLVTRVLIQLVPRAPGDEPLSGFHARLRLTDDQTEQWTDLDPFRGDATELSITRVDDGKTYDIELRAISTRNRPSNWTRIDAHFVVGKTTPPPDVTLAYRLADGRIDWPYPSPPLDFAGFLIRSIAGDSMADPWASAAQAHPFIVTAPPFDVSQVGYGVRTILIRAVDVANNVSTISARIVIDFGPAVPANVVEQIDHHPTFTIGAIDAGVVSGGELVGDSAAAFWPGADGGTFWPGAEPDADFWGTTGFTDLLYRWSYTPPESARLIIPYEIDGPQGWAIEWTSALLADAVVFWTGIDTAPKWTGVDSALWWGGGGADLADTWRAWPGAAQVEGATTYLFRVRATGGAEQPRVSLLSTVLDVEDVVLKFNDVDISALGTILDVDSKLRSISNIQLTLEDDGGTALTARWVDKSVSPGPTVKVFNASNVATTGRIDATITGARA